MNTANNTTNDQMNNMTCNTCDKKRLSGELMLLAAMLINSFSNALMAKSQLGVPPITSIPYVLSMIFPQISYGVWTYIYQGFLIAVLTLVIHRFDFNYIISFGLAIIYGYMIDMFTFIFKDLPQSMPFLILYAAMGIVGLAHGIALMLKCNLPVLPIDNVTRDIPKHFDISIKVWKTTFDMGALVITIILSAIFLGNFHAIGIGTVINALFTGKMVGFIATRFDNKYYCMPSIPFLEKFAWSMDKKEYERNPGN